MMIGMIFFFFQEYVWIIIKCLEYTMFSQIKAQFVLRAALLY